MTNQTIKLPSGASVTVQSTEAKPLRQMTEVEIAQTIESLRNERRRVQSRKDQEALEVRARTHVQIVTLRAELRFRKREGVRCPGCDGVGTLGFDRETGERIFCGGCALGLRLNLDRVRSLGNAIHANLAESGMSQLEQEAANENLDTLTAEHDRLTALLETLRSAR